MKTNLPSLRPRGLKLKTILATLLLTSLLTESATATETILKTGKAAPFNGVLVSEKTYRKYVENEFLVKNLHESNQMLLTQSDGLLQREMERRDNEPYVWSWFITGLGLGLASSLVLK